MRTYESDGLRERRVKALSHRGRLLWSLNHRSSVTAIGAGLSVDSQSVLHRKSPRDAQFALCPSNILAQSFGQSASDRKHS